MVQVDILVENMGRINFGHAPDFKQQKGLALANIIVNDEPISQFEVFAAEFKTEWINT